MKLPLNDSNVEWHRKTLNQGINGSIYEYITDKTPYNLILCVLWKLYIRQDSHNISYKIISCVFMCLLQFTIKCYFGAKTSASPVKKTHSYNSQSETIVRRESLRELRNVSHQRQHNESFFHFISISSQENLKIFRGINLTYRCGCI